MKSFFLHFIFSSVCLGEVVESCQFSVPSSALSHSVSASRWEICIFHKPRVPFCFKKPFPACLTGARQWREPSQSLIPFFFFYLHHSSLLNDSYPLLLPPLFTVSLSLCSSLIPSIFPLSVVEGSGLEHMRVGSVCHAKSVSVSAASSLILAVCFAAISLQERDTSSTRTASALVEIFL